MLKDEPTLDDLKAGVDIVEYIGRHVVLKKSGREHVGLCPIHGESTPSMYVNESKQLFHCYGCGAGGSVLDFIMGLYGVNEGEAANQLRSELGVNNGVPVLEKKRVLTREQEVAEGYISRCKLAQPCGALMSFGIVLPSAYEDSRGNLSVPLRSNRAIEDVFISDNNRGKRLNKQAHDGWNIVGNFDQYSRHLYITNDYIDAIYLHKNTGSNKLIIFSPCIHRAIDRAKREFPNHEIRLALANTTDSEIILETWGGLYTMPEQTGYWCEKSRKQSIKGCKKA